MKTKFKKSLQVNNKLITQGQIKTSMQKMRATHELIPQAILKMPSINDLHFPKMKSRLNLQEIKLFKNSKSTHLKESEEQNQSHEKLARSYSMSLMTIKKDLKNIHSPKKKRLIPNRQHIMCIKGRKGQISDSPLKNVQSMKLAFESLEKQKYHKKGQEKNFQNNLTEGSNQQLLRNSLYPGVKFESSEYAQKRTQFLKKLLPGLDHPSIDSILATRIPKKKPLFNGKFLVNKKLKEQLPDELITRKLIWDGKQMKKIDHNLIYRDIIEKSKNQKNQKIQQENPENSQDKFLEFMRLSAWEFHDENRQGKHLLIKTSRD